MANRSCVVWRFFLLKHNKTCCLKLKKQPATNQLNKRYNVSKLLLPDVQYQYQVAIQNRFSALTDRSGEWDTFKDAHTEVAQEVCSMRRF